MEIKIYQNYYLEEQKQYLDTAFIQYDNTDNKEPELREYPILKKLQQKHCNDDLYWGLVSWRWEEKVKVDGKNFIQFIKNNPGYDLYHINYDHKGAQNTKNFLEHGELHHKGMRKYFQVLNGMMNWNLNTSQQLEPKYFITCHNYVMHASIWTRWMEFIDECLRISYNDEKLNSYLMVETSQRYGKRIPNFSFVVERLIVLFCLLENLKVIEYFESTKHIPNRLRK